MTGLWDLKLNPTTWDFCVFLVCVKTIGAEKIHFKYEGEIQTKKYPKEIAWNRFNNILVPLCRLAEIPQEIGPGLDGLSHGYHAADLERVFKETGRLFKFSTDYRAVQKKFRYVTITIRESFRNMERNSNRAAWDSFADHLKKQGKKVIVLEDREMDPIPVAERMSLYQYADMNYGVNNGPMAMLICSEAPYRIFNMIPKANPGPWRDYMNKGFPEGSQYSFRNENQRVIWEPDDLEVLLRNE